MKRFIVFLLVSLVIVGSVFADTNLSWGRVGAYGIPGHTTDDFVYCVSEDDIRLGKDYASGTIIQVLVFTGTDPEFIAFSYAKLGDIKSKPNGLWVGQDLTNNFSDSLFIRFDSAMDNTCVTVIDDYDILLKEMLNNNKIQVCVSFVDTSFLLFEVNCKNLNKFFY